MLKGLTCFRRTSCRITFGERVKKMSCESFVQRLNPITNKVEWEKVDEKYDYHQEIARAAYADMLHDDERNKLFAIGLKKAINKFHSRGKRAKVLDIGTGTGLLSMLACSYGADSVTACDAFLPMANCAHRITRQNNFDMINIIKKHSTDVTVGNNGDMKERANILIAEVFDTELIGEGAIKTFNHAHEHLLEDDAIVIPSSGTVYAQVVESSLAQKWNRLNPWMNHTECVVTVPPSMSECPGSAAVHDIQLSMFPQNEFKALTPPISVFEFNWNNKNIPYVRQNVLDFTALEKGTAQVVFMWWDLVMDTEGEDILSCAPVWEHRLIKQTKNNSSLDNLEKNLNKLLSIPWRDHWIQAVYYLPQDVHVEKNEAYQLVSCHDEFSLWFDINNKVTSGQVRHIQRPVCSCGLHFLFSRTRIGALNENSRQKQLIDFFKKQTVSDSVFIFLGDLSISSIIVARLNALRVYTLESGLNKNILKQFISCNGVEDKVILKSCLKEIVANLIQYSKTKHFSKLIVFSEPFFVSSVLPWDNVRFWYLKNEFLSTLLQYEAEDVDTVTYIRDKLCIFPVKAVMYGVAIEFDDLWKIRAPVVKCEEFDMRLFDELIIDSSNQADSRVEAQPLWEYPGKSVTDPFKIIEFDFRNDNHFCESKVTGDIAIEADGICDGVAMWIEYHFDDGTKLSFGPTSKVELNKYINWNYYERQGVYLFHKRQILKMADSLKYEMLVNISEAEFNLKILLNDKLLN